MSDLIFAILGYLKQNIQHMKAKLIKIYRAPPEQGPPKNGQAGGSAAKLPIALAGPESPVSQVRLVQ